jgi:HSP20 family protein
METRAQKTNQTKDLRGESDLTVREPKAPARESGTREGAYFEPPVDIYETDEALVLHADVPGTTSEEVETHLEDNLLTITAPVKPVDAEWRPAYEEYAVGHYVRQFRVGQQIDQAKITATLKDGVLTMVLPKVDAARPRRITVKAG